jgi:acetyltransferase-like isoleucine patch superfamily enzyme
MRRLAFAYERWWTDRRLTPQLDALGPGALVSAPWHVEVFGGGVSAGRHLHILAARDLVVRLTTWPAPGEEARIAIGDCVLICAGVHLTAAEEIAIGDGAMLARGVTITDCDWHGLYDRVTAVQEPRPVRIGANVWIGDHAFIGKGVAIGDNAVIGARSVVMSDVEANTVVAGNPARMVKQLDQDAPRVTRMDLYKDPGALAAYFEAAWDEANPGNTTIGWARALLAPRRGD